MRRSMWVPIAVVLMTAAAIAAAPRATESARARLATSASRFLDSLRPELRAKASLPFDSPARKDWHYIPRDRPGVMLKEMNDDERRAAQGLLRAALSSRGYLKADWIMQLDAVLHETAGPDDTTRDPLKYTFAIFGEPKAGSTWGWKIEGHHISLSICCTPSEAVATSPAFFGTAPAEVQHGPHAGLKVLAAEEDLARALLDSLSESQRKSAVLETPVPKDIIMTPGHDHMSAAAGISAAELTAAQRPMLMRVIEEFAGNMEADLAAQRMERVHADDAAIRFAWIGALTRGRPHYYRIQGPRFVIEYDTTQDDPNHIHTVWRDVERDFGGDLLREHLEKDHAK